MTATRPLTETPSATTTLLDRYRAVRSLSTTLCEPLEIEDFGVQSMPDCSPAKWHLAHTTWFFETFLLAAANPDHQPFHPAYGYLFNSYYEAVGERHARPRRGLITRPTVAETYAYREAVDAAVAGLLEGGLSTELRDVLEVGLHHEQQHQELLLTDLKHLFSCNPLEPAYRPAPRDAGGDERPAAVEWTTFDGGLVEIGHGGDDFAFDNETPRHRVHLQPFQLAGRLVTNGEFAAFVEDGGYERPEFWLSEGWGVVLREGWTAPLNWRRESSGEWTEFTLHGRLPLAPAAPVCHVGHFEADAYARWADARLPTEFEWEHAAGTVETTGHFVDDALAGGLVHPRPAPGLQPLEQMFGDTWEWTASPYVAYPGYRPLPGALGEYNGKFMSNQMVLRGGSVATSRSHVRSTYRNFFPSHARWQFSGFRLARDVDNA